MIKTVIAMALSLLCSWALALELNQADVSELQNLKGVGPKTAEQIVAARKSQRFNDWGDFQARVKGIGPGKASALSKQGLTVGGKPYSPAQAQKAATAKSK